jgi:hypothetical protein
LLSSYSIKGSVFREVQVVYKSHLRYKRLKSLAKKAKVRRLSKRPRRAVITAPRLVNPGGVLYTLIIVIKGAF